MSELFPASASTVLVCKTVCLGLLPSRCSRSPWRWPRLDGLQSCVLSNVLDDPVFCLYPPHTSGGTQPCLPHAMWPPLCHGGSGKGRPRARVRAHIGILAEMWRAGVCGLSIVTQPWGRVCSEHSVTQIGCFPCHSGPRSLSRSQSCFIIFMGSW